MKFSNEQLELVKDRIALINKLIELKEHFRGREKTTRTVAGDLTHPYKDYSALITYLLLTCFDVLGQPNDWVDFNSWLRSKKRKKEREDIISKNYNSDYSTFILSVNNQYNKLYGAKSSFIKFIREILTPENKKKLFNSIATSKIIPQKIETNVPHARRIELDEHYKENFIYKIRNSFTHKGVAIANASGGVFNIDEPDLWPPDWKPAWGYSEIHREKIKGDEISFSVQRWPFVLIEIIEDQIEFEKKNS